MPEAKCPECGQQHDIFESEYAVSKSNGKILVMNDQILTATENISNDDLIKRSGPVMYCPKNGEFIAVGKIDVTMKSDEISDEIIKF